MIQFCWLYSFSTLSSVGIIFETCFSILPTILFILLTAVNLMPQPQQQMHFHFYTGISNFYHTLSFLFHFNQLTSNSLSNNHTLYNKTTELKNQQYKESKHYFESQDNNTKGSQAKPRSMPSFETLYQGQCPLLKPHTTWELL